MIEVGAVFGGEENGGLIFPKHQYCRDGAMTVAKLLEIVTREGPLSKLVDRIPTYCQDKRKMVCDNDRKEEVLAALVEHYRSQRVDTTDGVKICYDDGWTLVRPSGTEPLFRVYSEARTAEMPSVSPRNARRSCPTLSMHEGRGAHQRSDLFPGRTVIIL
jgi:phosphomannomutase/phosphoglucomutase